MGPTASHLDVYQRTPNLALPMGKRDLSKEEQDALKPLYPKIHNLRELCFAGFDYDLLERDTVSSQVTTAYDSSANTICSSTIPKKSERHTLRSSGSKPDSVYGSAVTRTTSQM